MSWRDMVANVQNTTARTFTEDVLYTPEGLAEIPFIGIFRQPFVALDLENNTEVSSLQPTLDVVLANLPQPPSKRPNGLGDRIIVPRLSLRYRVVNIEEDGEGNAKLYLHLQPIG